MTTEDIESYDLTDRLIKKVSETPVLGNALAVFAIMGLALYSSFNEIRYNADRFIWDLKMRLTRN